MVKGRVLEIVRFVRKHHAMLDTFRELQAVLLGIFQRRRALQFPVATRWYSTMACFKSVLSNQAVLGKLFRGIEYDALRRRYETTAASRAKLDKVKETVRDRDESFWAPLKKAIHIMEPIVDAPRKLEADDCPTSHVYAHFRALLFHEEYKSSRPKEFLLVGTPDYDTALELTKWKRVNAWDSDEEKILKLVWKRWRFFHSPGFGIAFLLDPRSDMNDFVEDDLEDAITHACAFAQKAKIIERLNMDEKEIKRRLDNFVAKRKEWTAQQRERHENPRVWWKLYGSQRKYAFLLELANIVLAVPTSPASSARVWSAYNRVHTKSRNRLGTKKVKMISFIYVNDGVSEDIDPDEFAPVGPDDFPDHEEAQFLPVDED